MPGVGTTHHVRLGGHYYLLRPGSYRKQAAPQFGARFTSGDPDYNNLSFWQHWAQRCFVGGMDAEEWADDAMYDDGVGLNTWEHEKVTLTRDLQRGAGANWTLGGSGNQRYIFIVYNQKLHVLRTTAAGVASRLYVYNVSTDGWDEIAAFFGTNTVARSIGTFNGKLFVGGQTIAGSPVLRYSSGALSSWTTPANPAGVTQAVYGLRSFQRKLYAAYGTAVWRMKEDYTWDGNTVFYQADQNSESNYVLAFEVHLGFLYMLSQNGHIHRTDGNTTFDIWSWDGQATGVALRSYDGRLFVATNEYEDPDNPGAHFGVLYQMSGSAMTELKRWGKVTESTGLGSLRVHARKLYYGASNLLGLGAGFGVAQYDAVEDAHSIFASNHDTVTYTRGSNPFVNYIVDDVIFFNGKMFAATRGHGVFFTPLTHRDRSRGLVLHNVTNAGASLLPLNGGWLTSSTYDAGTPGLRKLWRKIIVDYELPHSSTGIVLEYSLNNGSTWTTATTLSTGTSVTRTRAEVWLENKISVSLKLRLTLRSTTAQWSPTFYGWTVSYLPIPEPNWMWTFTIVLSEKQQLMDGTTETVDTETELNFLRDSYRTKQLLAFVDADGTLWATGGQPGVLIHDISFTLYDLTQPLEGEVTVTLLEAVETY